MLDRLEIGRDDMWVLFHYFVKPVITDNDAEHSVLRLGGRHGGTPTDSTPDEKRTEDCDKGNGGDASDEKRRRIRQRGG